MNKNKIIGLSVAFGIIGFYLYNKKKPAYKKPSLNKRKFVLTFDKPTQLIGNKIGVPPLFILSQIALETGFNTSELSNKHFNFGGIKATKGQPFVEYNTKECKGKNCYTVKQKFAKFPNIIEGLKAQSKIYQNKYFKKYLNKTTNPYVYADLIQSGTVKYATEPKYSDKIKKMIKDIGDIKKAL